MFYDFTLTKFETRAERPLFTGDCAAYRLTVPLPAEESGLLTVAAYRPDTENPVLVSEAFSGTVASATLAAGQYDKEGETRFLCTVSDENGGVLTTRLLYATVLRGIAQGTPAPDDKTALSALLSEAGKAVSECSAAASSATEAAAEAREAAALVVNVPTKFSQLTDDVGYLKKTEASATYIPQMIMDTQSCEVSTANGKFYLTTARGGKLYIGGDPETVFLNGLMTPTEDTSAATKKYVDDAVTSAITTALNTAV